MDVLVSDVIKEAWKRLPRLQSKDKNESDFILKVYGRDECLDRFVCMTVLLQMLKGLFVLSQ